MIKKNNKNIKEIIILIMVKEEKKLFGKKGINSNFHL